MPGALDRRKLKIALHAHEETTQLIRTRRQWHILDGICQAELPSRNRAGVKPDNMREWGKDRT